MKKGIIGKKIGMTQLFDEKGNVIPVTVINAGPCVVVAKKTADKEGYASVQLGNQDIAERTLTKPALSKRPAFPIRNISKSSVSTALLK